MMMNFTKMSLANTMMIGVIMTICSNNWISMWMGIELSLMSFIPFIQNEMKNSSESMIKYFIIQSIASTMFLCSVIFMLVGDNMMNEMMLTMSMIIKLGVAPFHNWVLMMINNISYWTLFSLLTIMKIPPLVVLYQINSSMIIIPMILSAVFGAISCMNQTSMKKTIGYSSIFNLGLMLTSINKFNNTIMFLVIYSTMMMMLIMIIKEMKINWINQMVFNSFPVFLKMNLWINMLSMAGFPPLLGFSMKMLIFENLVMNNQMMLTSIILMSSMLVMMFYTRLAFSCMLNSSLFKKWLINCNKSLFFLMSMNIMITPFSMTMLSLI
uniref:NADH-ubiquinone oxidoreductase chain 2 n=1 Tax=Maiestas dorsalis TaxID=1928073 RepID=A0A343ASR9_9HEMI|nr:NADH dehydrogenase subunit 2 [Maiestas dorsalis]APO09330.1 NADH dehydrogenase subunit 2 [Maiestas dorsalis]